jgi:hypothetical protein
LYLFFFFALRHAVCISLFFCVCFIDRWLSFVIFWGHCVVCSFSIYALWLPLWYRQSLLKDCWINLSFWSLLHSSCIYNYLCYQCISSVKWVWIPLNLSLFILIYARLFLIVLIEARWYWCDLYWPLKVYFFIPYFRRSFHRWRPDKNHSLLLYLSLNWNHYIKHKLVVVCWRTIKSLLYNYNSWKLWHLIFDEYGGKITRNTC